MMDRLYRLAALPIWQRITEDPGLWAAESPLTEALPHLPLVREVRAARLLTLVAVRADGHTLATVAPDGSVVLTEELPFDAEEAWDCVQLIQTPGIAEATRMTVLARLAGDQAVLRVELDKSTAFRRTPGEQVWLDPARFDAWFGQQPVLERLALLGGPAPLVLVAPHPPSSLSGYRLACSDRTEEALSQYRTAFARRLQRLDAHSDAPVVLPELFDLEQLSDILRPMATYALATSSARQLLRAGADDVTVQIAGSTGPLRFAAAPTALADLSRKRQQTLRESDAYEAVWNAALDAVLKGDPQRLIAEPDAVLARFEELRDRLLTTNLDRLLGNLEKAQGALNQLTGQLTKEMESVATDMEKAILGTLTSGVLTLVGAVLKTGQLDLVGPLVGALALMLYLPFLLGRLAFFEQSVGRKTQDFADTLLALQGPTGHLLQTDRLTARFEQYLGAAREQIARARRWMAVLAAFLLTLGTWGGSMALLNRQDQWLAALPVVASLSLVAQPTLRAQRWLPALAVAELLWLFVIAL